MVKGYFVRLNFPTTENDIKQNESFLFQKFFNQKFRLISKVQICFLHKFAIFEKFCEYVVVNLHYGKLDSVFCEKGRQSKCSSHRNYNSI